MKKIWNKWRMIVYMIVSGIIIGMLFSLYFSWGHPYTPSFFVKLLVSNSILGVFLGGGSKLIITYLLRKYNWREQTIRIAVLHFVVSAVYSVLVLFVFYMYLWFVVRHKNDFTGFFDSYAIGFYLCIFIYFIISLVFYCYFFFVDWKKSLLNEERLQRESLAMQYESLKNQVNPHFLFNSLNALTSLIERDQEASINYVKRLSEVFRYVLDQNVRELTSIADEMKFLDSYYFLQKIRFDDHFKMDVNLSETNFFVVPLSMQILIENAIKHNEISGDYPLAIRIYDEADYLVVENNIQPRKHLPESNKIGLKNIEFQYSFLSGKNIEVIHFENQFVVKLPKIKSNKHAGAGN